MHWNQRSCSLWNYSIDLALVTCVESLFKSTLLLNCMRVFVKYRSTNPWYLNHIKILISAITLNISGKRQRLHRPVFKRRGLYCSVWHMQDWAFVVQWLSAGTGIHAVSRKSVSDNSSGVGSKSVKGNRRSPTKLESHDGEQKSGSQWVFPKC